MMDSSSSSSESEHDVQKSTVAAPGGPKKAIKVTIPTFRSSSRSSADPANGTKDATQSAVPKSAPVDVHPPLKKVNGEQNGNNIQNDLTEADIPPVDTNMVPMAHILDRTLQRTFVELMNHVELLPSKISAERRMTLLKWAMDSRLHFIKLLAIARWSTVARRIQLTQNLIASLQGIDAAFVNAHGTMNGMLATVAPQVASNVDLEVSSNVLNHGSYTKMPTVIREAFSVQDAELSTSERQDTMDKLNESIKLRVLQEIGVPRSMLKNMVVASGTASFSIPNLFKVVLTLPDPSRADSKWHLLDLDVYIRTIPRIQRLELMHLLASKVMLCDSRFSLREVYTTMKKACLDMLALSFRKELASLMEGRWKGWVGVDLENGGKSVKIGYWPIPSDKLRASSTQDKDKRPYPWRRWLKVGLKNTPDIITEKATKIRASRWEITTDGSVFREQTGGDESESCDDSEEEESEIFKVDVYTSTLAQIVESVIERDIALHLRRLECSILHDSEDSLCILLSPSHMPLMPFNLLTYGIVNARLVAMRSVEIERGNSWMPRLCVKFLDAVEIVLAVDRHKGNVRIIRVLQNGEELEMSSLRRVEREFSMPDFTTRSLRSRSQSHARAPSHGSGNSGTFMPEDTVNELYVGKSLHQLKLRLALRSMELSMRHRGFTCLTTGSQATVDPATMLSIPIREFPGWHIQLETCVTNDTMGGLIRAYVQEYIGTMGGARTEVDLDDLAVGNSMLVRDEEQDTTSTASTEHEDEDTPMHQTDPLSHGGQSKDTTEKGPNAWNQFGVSLSPLSNIELGQLGYNLYYYAVLTIAQSLLIPQFQVNGIGCVSHPLRKEPDVQRYLVQLRLSRSFGDVLVFGALDLLRGLPALGQEACSAENGNGVFSQQTQIRVAFRWKWKDGCVIGGKKSAIEIVIFIPADPSEAQSSIGPNFFGTGLLTPRATPERSVGMTYIHDIDGVSKRSTSPGNPPFLIQVLPFTLQSCVGDIKRVLTHYVQMTRYVHGIEQIPRPVGEQVDEFSRRDVEFDYKSVTLRYHQKHIAEVSWKEIANKTVPSSPTSPAPHPLQVSGDITVKFSDSSNPHNSFMKAHINAATSLSGAKAIQTHFATISELYDFLESSTNFFDHLHKVIRKFPGLARVVMRDVSRAQLIWSARYALDFKVVKGKVLMCESAKQVQRLAVSDPTLQPGMNAKSPASNHLQMIGKTSVLPLPMFDQYFMDASRRDTIIYLKDGNFLLASTDQAVDRLFSNYDAWARAMLEREEIIKAANELKSQQAAQANQEHLHSKSDQTVNKNGVPPQQPTRNGDVAI